MTSHTRFLIGPRIALVVLGVTLNSGAFAQNLGDIVYRGHDLGITFDAALAQIQQQYGLFVNTWANPETADKNQIHADSASFEVDYYNEFWSSQKAPWSLLDLSSPVVEKAGVANGAYDIDINSKTPGGILQSSPYHVITVNQMSVTIWNEDTTQINHLADLLATIGARLGSPGRGRVSSPSPNQALIVPPVPRSNTQPGARVLTPPPAPTVPPPKPPPPQGVIVASIDSSMLNSNGGTNYVRFTNIGNGPATFTAWTTSCQNLEVARCGTILSNVRLAPGSQAGFWINRQDGSQPWSYTVGCSVSPGATAQCGVSGGGGAKIPWQVTPDTPATTSDGQGIDPSSW